MTAIFDAELSRASRGASRYKNPPVRVGRRLGNENRFFGVDCVDTKGETLERTDGGDMSGSHASVSLLGNRRVVGTIPATAASPLTARARSTWPRNLLQT